MMISERHIEKGLNYEELYLGAEQWDLYHGLYEGLRDKRDPVTVRTFLIDVAKILGVERPEWEEVPEEKWSEVRLLVGGLVKDTSLEVLEPELLESLGVKLSDEEISSLKPIKLLVANGRHLAEPLWGGLIGCVSEKFNDSVGGFNPVGHYNDDQSRVAGIRRLLRPVEEFVVLGSTQEQKGGNLAVLSHVARLIRNEDFATKIGRLTVTIPMFGGSRGHRSGQRDGLVYEVKETVSDPKIIALPLIDAWQCLEDDLIRDAIEMGDLSIEKMNEIGEMMPDLRIVTVDIHNDELPKRKFDEMGIEFISADVSFEIADKTVEILKNKNMLEKPWLLEASDEGAIPRNEKSAREILLKSGKNEIFVSHMVKTRLVAGIVEDVEMGDFCKWTLVDGKVIKIELSEEEKKKLFDVGLVLIKSDDMMDTGGTNKKDEKFLRERMRVDYSVTIATHPVFSKGAEILDDIGSDVYIFTNTLMHNGLSGRDDVVIVDASPAIARALNIK